MWDEFRRRYRPLNWDRVAIIILGCMLIQTTVLAQLTSETVPPDLLLPLVIIFSVRTSWRNAAVLGWTVGIMKDLYSGTPFGTYALLFTLTGMFCARFAERTFVDHVAILAVLSLIIALALNAACIFMVGIHRTCLTLGIYKGLISSMFSPAVLIILYPVARLSGAWLGVRRKMAF